MKIERHTLETMSIEEFAEKHDLTMEIRERKSVIKPFCANFKGARLMYSNRVIGDFGEGITEQEAISNYANLISNGKLVFNLFLGKVPEIQVPYLTARSGLINACEENFNER